MPPTLFLQSPGLAITGRVLEAWSHIWSTPLQARTALTELPPIFCGKVVAFWLAGTRLEIVRWMGGMLPMFFNFCSPGGAAASQRRGGILVEICCKIVVFRPRGGPQNHQNIQQSEL